MSDLRICPACEEAGKRSRVEQLLDSRAPIPMHVYWDKKGRRHEHNPNDNGPYYRCSRGHHFSQSHYCDTCQPDPHSYGSKQLKAFNDLLDQYGIGTR